MAPVCVVVELNLPPFAYDRNAKDGRPAAAPARREQQSPSFQEPDPKRPPKISSPHEERPPAPKLVFRTVVFPSSTGLPSVYQAHQGVLRFDGYLPSADSSRSTV